MKTRVMTTVAVAGLLAALAAGNVLAAGNGNGGGKGQRNGTRACTQSANGAAATTRPADSQRRDGTFLTTGVTANGSATRQGKANGLMDGSHVTSTVAPAVTANP